MRTAVRILAFALAASLPGCNEPRVPTNAEDEGRAREACASWCSVFEACERALDDCVPSCLETDSLQTQHCFEEEVLYLECLGRESTCEYIENYYTDDAHPEPSPCPAEKDTASRCLSRHRDAIDAELDKN